MAHHETNAFTIRTYPFSEIHKVCVFFTQQAGVVKAVAHGSRKLKSRYGSTLELFSEVRLKYREREGQELVQLTDCELVKSHFDAASNPETGAMLAYWGELLTELFPAHQANDHAYRLVSACLKCVESGLDADDALLGYFETWILKLAGFFPDIQNCSSCGLPVAASESLFLSRDGSPECASCAGERGPVLGAEARRAIRTMLRQSPADFAARELSPAARTQLRDMNQRLVVTALERELKSHAVLRQLREFAAR